MRAFGRWVAFLGVMSLVTYFTVSHLSALRAQIEPRFEKRWGAEVVDREPPFSPAERILRALDVEPGIYWWETAGFALILGFFNACFAPLGMLLGRKLGRRVGIGILVNGAFCWLWLRLPEITNLNLIGIQIPGVEAVGLLGLTLGFLHGLFSFWLMPGKNKTGGAGLGT